MSDKPLDPQVDLTDAPEVNTWQRGFYEGLEEGEKKGRREGIREAIDTIKGFYIGNAMIQVLEKVKDKLLEQINGK